MERLLKISKEAGLIILGLVIFTIVSAVCLVIGVELYKAGYGFLVFVELLLYLFVGIVTSMYVTGEHK